MLQLILGRAGFGKTFKIQEIIKEILYSNTNTTRVMLIVPEQSSFDTEKSILDLLGTESAAKVQVATFTRLVDLVARKFGGDFGQKINKADRNLLMSLAIDEVADKLEIYSGQVGKTEFVELMVSALTEFKMCSVIDSSLLEILSNITDPVLKKKIQETSLILKAYEALLQNTYIEPLDELTRLARKLSEHNFFNEYVVLFDGFDGFTMQQFSILEIILKQCEACYITLCTDAAAFSDNEINIFSPINQTAKKILNIAKKNYVVVKTPIFLENPKRFKNNGLKLLESYIFRTKKEKFEQKVDDTLIFAGNTKYDEADFVCRMIKKFIYEGNYKYNDFAVITRNDEIYRGILDVAFEKYKIPYFMDSREEITTKPLMLVVLSALEIVNNNFSSQSVFKYLKTGLIGMGADEISELENYVLFWNINGKRWLEEFTANPDGYIKMNEESKEKLLRINTLRKKVIFPLQKIRQDMDSVTGDDITRKIYNFLCDINIIENLKNFCQELSEVNQQGLAEEQVKLWDLLIEILDKMAIILKNRKISLKKYAELLKLVMSSYDIAHIPRKVDEVIFGSVDRVRVQNKKVVFLIGAVEGEFPRVPVASGIFTDVQRKQLIELGLPLYDAIEGLAINERFLAYKAVTMPSEKLFITWSCSTTLGGAKSASAIVREIKFILPNMLNVDDFSEELSDKIWEKKPAFEICAKHWHDKSRFSETIKEYFFRSASEYREKLQAIETVTSMLPLRLEDSQKIKATFGENMQISATQIEKFYLCKFAYFCKYGILAKERKKAKFDALQYGNVIHFIFEKILKKFKVNELLNFSRKELLCEVKNILNYYIEENLGGWTDKTERFRYLFSRTTNAVVPLILHMARELSQSEFRPVAFELELSNKHGVMALEVKLSDGTSVTVGGKMDRVDIMRCGEKSFVRVIDYKTGAKEFNLSDVLFGLNLQMLIYLEAFCKNPASGHEQKIPAGVLYLPSVSTTLNLDRDEDLGKLEKEKMKKLRMNGLILNNEQVIMGMEADANGVYIPVALKDGKPKNYDYIVDVAQMEAIMRHIDRLVISMAEQLHKGDISVQPAKGIYDACEFCEYKSVCAQTGNENCREIENLKRDEFFKRLKLEQKDGDDNA